MPKTTRLIRLLLPEANHVEIPRALYAAARRLWAHEAGHMVSLNHVGNGGNVLRVRLTGRGRDLAEALCV